MTWLRFALVLLAWLAPVSAQAEPSTSAQIPAENLATLHAPPARPPASEVDQKARLLFDAIVHDDPQRALECFFPRDAFLKVKAIADPGRYYDELRARFIEDIHSLHRQTPELAQASFARFELVQRGGWIKVGEEANRLPYWASRHSWLHYNVGKSQRKLEVRVLITWGPHWYVIHLSEFHKRSASH
jgi:hypothetical protein